MTVTADGHLPPLCFVAGIMLFLMSGPVLAVRDQAGSHNMTSATPPPFSGETQPVDRSRLSFTAVNPFLHRLPSGLKFRGLKLYDNIYLSPQKQATDVNKALGISYADDGILYYFSPQLLSISFRY
jgi:hypothetical protein